MKNKSILETAKLLNDNDLSIGTWLPQHILPILKSYISKYRLDIALADDMYQEILIKLFEDFQNGKLNQKEGTYSYLKRRCRIIVYKHLLKQHDQITNEIEDDFIDIEEYRNCWKIPEDYKDGDDYTNIDFLYKYMPLNQYTYNVLINSELWYSNPYNFNDPFDCSLKIDASEKKSQNNDKNKLDRKINKELNKIGVSCFSKDYRNILMWSHYSDSHKGICLIFDYSKDIHFFNPFDILYTNEYPDIHDKLKKDELIKKLIYTKSDNWRYEREVRSIKSGCGTYKFDSSLLKGIILGYKTTTEDLKTIKNIINRRYSEIEIYKMVRSENKFEIEKQQISTNNKK